MLFKFILRVKKETSTLLNEQGVGDVGFAILTNFIFSGTICYFA
jgi:hypothetical protein